MDRLRQAGILDNELRWCHFAATVFEETGDFRELRESLRYTTCGALRSTWPSRFGHKTDDDLRPLLKNERALAAEVYKGRMGNKTAADAFDYRGGGWIQTTGREAVERYCAKLGIEAGPETLDDPVTTLQFAILEWTEAKCNEWADQNDIRKVAKAINTGSATSNVQPVGMDDRKRAFARAWQLWGETGAAESPTGIDDVKKAVVGSLVKAAVPMTGAGAGAAHIASQGVPQVPDVVSQGIASAQAWQVVGSQVSDLAGWVIAKPLISLPLVAVVVVLGWIAPKWAEKQGNADAA